VHHPDPEQEFAHYQTHQNDLRDEGYRKYLSRLCEPLLDRLKPNSSGFDYGCGPGPALAAMLREAGHEVAVYDPFFVRDKTPLAGSYDFITCTETAEHFHKPQEEFALLASLLNPGGVLAVMTIFQTDDDRFENWRYRQDPTHVVFYRPSTFHVIARQLKLGCELVCKDVMFLTRSVR
jgi:2-polyprenyl-3-methyl-5-hydroxy-6-metoxy-1,4-benzoquinol methylase